MPTLRSKKIIYGRVPPGETVAETQNTHRQLAARYPGELVYEAYEDPFYAFRALDELTEALHQYRGPDRLIVSRRWYWTYGVGEPGGRYELAHRVWHETGGGPIVSDTIIVEHPGDGCSNDCLIWYELHHAKLRRHAEILAAARGSR